MNCGFDIYEHLAMCLAVNRTVLLDTKVVRAPCDFFEQG